MQRVLIILTLLFVASCGVKGDPVPPVDSGPEKAMDSGLAVATQ